MSSEAASAPVTGDKSNTWATNAAIVCATVLLISLAGILTRPTGFLATFWPANAVLLGLMIRQPAFAIWTGWAAAIAGFYAADLLTGSDVLSTTLLTAANMAGIFTGYLLYARRPVADQTLSRPSAMIFFMLIVTLASIAAGVVGSGVNPILFGKPALEGMLLWSVTELVNYVAILPVMLTAPWPPQRWKVSWPGFHQSRPLIAFLACLALEPMATGLPAFVLPIPALLWCALTYSLATTAALTLLFVVWTLMGVSAGYLRIGVPLEATIDVMSLRLGVMLVGLGPLTVASVMRAREEALHEAAAARSAAEEAVAARSLLLATMTHELRSPLMSIVSFAQLMGRERFGPLGHPKYVEFSRAVGTASGHLNELVTDLLDTAKVEAGQIEPEFRRVDSRQLTEQSLRMVRGIAMDRGITLSVAPGDWPEVWADDRAIKQVFINLLSNAVKFSPEGSPVVVSGEVVHGRMLFRVRDSGRGLSPEDLLRLGQPYVQAGDSTSRRQGTGLGLALSHRLVEQHGGRLRLESTMGAGTTAIFDLPLAPTDAAEESSPSMADG